jgi:hypothetical protein
MTSATDERIKALYENENLSVEQISQEEGFSSIAVKAKLMQVSSVYRKACGREPEKQDDLNFTDAELREVNQIIMDTARAAETADGMPDWKIRLQAATYIRDDKKGRKEIRSMMQNNSFNILSFNEKLAEVGEKTRRMKELVDV